MAQQSTLHPDAEWRRFLGQLSALLLPVSGVDPDTGRLLYRISLRLERPEALLVFAGLFSVGKSTVLNFGLGRSLLPTDDLPETGTLCFLRRGPRDEIAVHESEGRLRPLPCTRDAIRGEVSLLTANGTANGHVGRVNRLEIRLHDFPVAEGVCWIDSPGINSGWETERATQAADAADLLFWVLKSGQFLSETDGKAIADHVQRSGPESVVFVLNVFLNVRQSSEASAAWQRFQSKGMGSHLERLQDRLHQMGFPDGYKPPLVVLAAEDAFRDPSGYGGPEFRRLMSELRSIESPPIRRARLARAAKDLIQAADRMEVLLSQVRAENQEREFRLKEWEKEQQQRTEAFTADVRRAIEEYTSSFEREARRAGDAIAQTIRADNLSRDSTYSDQLNKALSQAAQTTFGKLKRDLDTAAERRGYRFGSQKQMGKLQKILAPADVTIAVPDKAMGVGKPLGGAAWGALIGSIFGPVGTAVGAAIGGMAGAGSSASEAFEEDAKGTRENTRSAAGEAGKAVKAMGEKASKHVLDSCERSSEEPPPAPDWAREQQLEHLLAELRDLVTTAAGMEAGGERS